VYAYAEDSRTYAPGMHVHDTGLQCCRIRGTTCNHERHERGLCMYFPFANVRTHLSLEQEENAIRSTCKARLLDAPSKEPRRLHLPRSPGLVEAPRPASA
jgi:hypothetical protein